jgi:NitT/TauT family transport system ATP-binding protein
VLLMDEPFAAVDAQTRADLEDLIRSVWQRLGVTLLFVTHDIDEAVYLAERVIVLSAAPTRIQEDLPIDLPVERDQLTTRSAPRFTELRAQIYAQIQKSKQLRPAMEEERS